MAERDYAVEYEHWIDAPPPVVWVLVADSNRFDRATGLAAAHYEFKKIGEGATAQRVRFGTAKQLGVRVHWREPPYEWIEGRRLRGFREYVDSPVSSGGMQVALVPERGGTRLTVKCFFRGGGPIAFALGPIMKARLRSGVRRYVDSIDAMLGGLRATGLSYDGSEPPAVIARQLLAGGTPDGVTSGTVTPTNETELMHRVRAFDESPIDASLRSRIVELVRTRPDDELTAIRPFELARAWGVDRRESLRAFLYAALSGIVDLNWQLNCPTCRVGSEVASQLGAVKNTAHCDACNIDYALDFAAHVEAVFKVSSTIRAVDTAVYCASSPWFRPHVFAQLRLAPGEERTLSATLPKGSLLIRTTTGRGRANLDAPDMTPAHLRVTIGDDSIEPSVDGVANDGADTEISLANRTSSEAVVLFERSGWSADVVYGSTISTLPEFLDLFATEAPATGVDLTVGKLTVLFSDLTGSTALYERMGDAKAFALVQEHFRLMTEAVTKHRGAIVKTMGDAVMANFSTPGDALRAAIDMVAHTERAHGGEGISVKLGLHEGACLAVRANDRLDFFGTTVNVAARLQAQARPSEIVIMESLLEHAEVARVIKENGLEARRFSANLKGIREEQRLAGLDARGKRHVSPPVDVPAATAI